LNLFDDFDYFLVAGPGDTDNTLFEIDVETDSLYLFRGAVLDYETAL
jgi:hypothetical protein